MKFCKGIERGGFLNEISVYIADRFVDNKQIIGT
jgi:hypothetical protein